jgi:hypothetical protein
MYSMRVNFGEKIWFKYRNRDNGDREQQSIFCEQ